MPEQATPDTKKLDLAALRKLAENAEAETYFPQLGKPAGMNPWTILSLLDRIEELEEENGDFGSVIERDGRDLAELRARANELTGEVTALKNIIDNWDAQDCAETPPHECGRRHELSRK